MNFRHLLGCDTIDSAKSENFGNLRFLASHESIGKVVTNGREDVLMKVHIFFNFILTKIWFKVTTAQH